jgi:hypothetical protein
MNNDNLNKTAKLQEEALKKIAEEKAKFEAQAKAKKKKEAEAKAKLPPPKFYYDIKVECMLPATLTYRVFAETPIQAADLIKGTSPIAVKHRLIGRKDIKLSVYNAGSSMLMWAKNLLGR